MLLVMRPVVPAVMRLVIEFGDASADAIVQRSRRMKSCIEFCMLVYTFVKIRRWAWFNSPDVGDDTDWGRHDERQERQSLDDKFAEQFDDKFAEQFDWEDYQRQKQERRDKLATETGMTVFKDIVCERCQCRINK